ncbi:Pycsar system effector family protein [Sediminicola sp. 1XM1-17]|uniref:Pycsar system effector family protein n=1 Tax=Sediminicola sp. 1XM1-17 TaxID=3127702 RepID=UPI003076CEFF
MGNLIKQTEDFVVDLLKNKLDEEHKFHNVQRTQEIVATVKKLLEEGQLKNGTEEVLVLAAWFLNTGYTVDEGGVGGHSSAIAREFLISKEYPEENVARVEALIADVYSKGAPQSPEAALLHDAVTAYYGEDRLDAKLELYRKEQSHLKQNDIPVLKWRNKFIKQLAGKHQYYTEYAKGNWEEGKKDNLKKLIKAKKKDKKEYRKAEIKVKMKDKSPQRGVQTLYRVTLRNHMKLSDIADTKANILLSVNAIIISLLLANLVPILDDPSNTYLLIPTSIFILFSIASMVLSVLATRPNVTETEFDVDNLEKEKINLLFFGNFERIPISNFIRALKRTVEDKDAIYEMLTMDLYYLGSVLSRKYRILRWTYTIFMTGIILSVISFAVALKFYGSEKVMEAVKPLTELPEGKRNDTLN